MSQLFHLLLSFLVPYFCSAASPMLASPPSLGLFSDSGIDPATVQVKTPLGHSYVVRCNSTQYGAGLNAQSCSNILAKSPTGQSQESWAYHRPGGPNPPVDVTLPVAVLSDDATCLMLPTLKVGVVMGHASAMNVTDAARVILQECVIKRRIGGAAGLIGGDNLVGVIMSSSQVRPRCAGTGTATTPPRSCRYIMDEMDKGVSAQRFGRTGAVDFALPLTIRAPDGKCQLVVDSSSPRPVIAHWFDIWIAVEATVILCVNNGRGGIAAVQPRHAGGTLHVSVMDEPAPSQVIALSAEGASNKSIYKA